MFEEFTVTNDEYQAIKDAFEFITTKLGDSKVSLLYAQMEASGYGRPKHRVPPILAEARCVSFFMDGLDAPDMSLLEVYAFRPAAMWFMGKAAHAVARKAELPMDLLRAARAAYTAALHRMGDSKASTYDCGLKYVYSLTVI